jgi:hypothetical protein
VFEPTEFRIDGVGTVRIRGALPDLAALREEHARLGEDLRGTLERYGAADAAELASAVERAKELRARCGRSRGAWRRSSPTARPIATR